MNKKHIIAILIIGIILYGCLGLFGGSPAGDLDFVPSTSNSLVILKIANFMQDKDVAEIYHQQTGKNLQDELAIAEAESGIKVSQFDKIIIFFSSEDAASIETSPEEAKFGIILRGTFDKNKILENARKNDTITESQYGGYTVYSTSKQPKMDFSFIQDGMMVAGTKGITNEVIDVKNGKLQSIKSNSNISRITENINMNSLFVFVVQIPESSKEELVGNVGPVNMKAFSSIHSIGLSLNKDGENIDLKYASLSDDANSASKVADTIDGMVKFAKGMVESGSKIETLLKKIVISSKGEILTIQLSTTTTELKEVGDELENMTAAAAPQTPLEQCTFPPGLTCVSWKLYTNGDLYLKVGQGTGKTIIVTGVKCTMSTSYLMDGGILYSPLNALLIPSGSVMVIADPNNSTLPVTCRDEAGNVVTGIAGETYSGNIYINYTELETSITRIAVGYISTKYESSTQLVAKQLCESAYGHWNECGSPCTGEPSGTVCTQVCVPICECGRLASPGFGAYRCPSGYYCKYEGKPFDVNTKALQNDTGKCVPIGYQPT